MVTAEAVQGAILNLIYAMCADSYLRTELLDESVLVELVQLKLNNVMHTVNAWMMDHGLSLALNKTEIFLS